MTTQRLTIQEAAVQLDVSEVTVRRRIKSGALNAEQEPTAQGHRWIVLLEVPEAAEESEETPAAGDQLASQSSHTTTQPADQHLVNELQSRIEYLERQFDDARRSHDRDRDDWSEERAARTREIERLHTLLAQEQQIAHALSQRLEALPGPEAPELQQSAQPKSETASSLMHTYVSALLSSVASQIPLVAGGTAFVTFIWREMTVEDASQQWLIIGILLPAVAVELRARIVVNRLKVLVEQEAQDAGVEIQKNTQLFRTLEMIGLILFVVATVLMWAT